jgi:ComF family protein
LPFLPDPACVQCGIPLPSRAGGAVECLGCLADPPAFQRAFAPLLYGGPARDTVLRFKNGREELAELMATLMLHRRPIAPQEIIVPVPLDRWRLVRRGYNQAALLARQLGARSGATIVSDALVRVEATRSTKGLSRAQRKEQAASAFRAHEGRRQAIRGRAICLVDDVMTTGATANACAAALLKAGATRVEVLVFARVAPEFQSA